jgi:hypothetical protein
MIALGLIYLALVGAALFVAMCLGNVAKQADRALEETYGRHESEGPHGR